MTSQAATTAQGLAPLGFPFGAGDGRDQRAGVFLLRRAEDGGGRIQLDDSALAHHGNAVRILRSHAKIMRDEQHAEVHAGLHVGDELQRLRLIGNIERGDRLVGNQQFRLQGQGARKTDALALAAGKLMRKPGIRRCIEAAIEVLWNDCEVVTPNISWNGSNGAFSLISTVLASFAMQESIRRKMPRERGDNSRWKVKIGKKTSPSENGLPSCQVTPLRRLKV